jgi:hypothetical protein
MVLESAFRQAAFSVRATVLRLLDTRTKESGFV